MMACRKKVTFVEALCAVENRQGLKEDIESSLSPRDGEALVSTANHVNQAVAGCMLPPEAS